MKDFEKLKLKMEKAKEEKANEGKPTEVKISRMESIWQILSVWLWITIIVWAELLCLIVFGYLVVNGGIIGRLFIVLYCTHWYNDRFAHENGQRGQGYEFVRKCAWLGHFAKFFSAKCVKTADLPADKNYLFAVFPHGMISIGAISNFATSHTDFRKLFPGIRSRVCTLNYHFLCPFYRELVLSWGLISSKAESITRLLRQSNNQSAVCNYDGYTSNAVVLIVGGAQEALYSRPGKYHVILKKRKGFVKIAIKTGASLVPVITFGEVDLFDQSNNDPGTKIRAYQDFVKKWTGVAPAFFHGRGFSEKSFGWLPYRRPLTTVIGAPIEVVMNETPTQEEIDSTHTRFSEALVKLFDDHKKDYIANYEKVNLTFE